MKIVSSYIISNHQPAVKTKVKVTRMPVPSQLARMISLYVCHLIMKDVGSVRTRTKIVREETNKG